MELLEILFYEWTNSFDMEGTYKQLKIYLVNDVSKGKTRLINGPKETNALRKQAGS